jgi:hypothetical protein
MRGTPREQELLVIRTGTSIASTLGHQRSSLNNLYLLRDLPLKNARPHDINTALHVAYVTMLHYTVHPPCNCLANTKKKLHII